jgi:ferric-dicitrate binding protein FerR (iron transport regulator)
MDEKLMKYFSRFLSLKEKEDLFRELDRKEDGKDEFAHTRNLLSMIMMHEKDGDDLYAQRKYREFKRTTRRMILHRVSLQVAKYAAIMVLSIASWTLYQKYTDSYPENAAYTVIEAPSGHRTHIFLPDGTNVWLNADTRLSYSAAFSAGNRTVELDGEGYFEVADDRKHPFTVKTPLMDVKVLGTKFNVKSYTGETSFVTLMEGIVEVVTSDETNKLTLQPGEQASISADGNPTLSGKLGAEYANAWTNGEFNYLNDRLADIAKDLERRFNVEITITDQTLANEIFTYRAEGNVSLEQILEHLKGTRELNYERESEHIKIYKR